MNIGAPPSGGLSAREFSRFSGDFNGDGTTDLLLTLIKGDISDVWFIQNGTYAGQEPISAPWGDLVGTGDFDGDATTDLLFLHTTHVDYNYTTTLVDFSIKNGTATNIGTPGSGWSVVNTGDFNGDATTDVLFQYSTTGMLADWFIKNGTYAGATNIGAVPSGWNLIP